MLRQHRIPLLVLIAITLAAYGRMLTHDFVNFDDPEYTYQTPQIANGFTAPNANWALSSVVAGNWHPMTIWSLQLNASFAQQPHSAIAQKGRVDAGLSPFPFLLTNLVLHVFNACLLYLVLFQMVQRGHGPGTMDDDEPLSERRAMFYAWLVAALFAVHPLHVESVAWISERKDVLSVFFVLLTILAYIHKCKQPSLGSSLMVVGCLLLGLMSKPMLVTLPCVLLLLDLWPLGRLRPEHREGSTFWAQVVNLVLEKIPLFVLSAAVSAMTILTQKPHQHMYSVVERVKNSLLSYAAYLRLTLWPQDLTIFYPLSREALPLVLAVLAGGVLLAVSIYVIREMGTRPYLIVGWFWFLGTLVPVIGLVQVGSQAMADRYVYLPHIGLFMMLVWGIGERLPEWLRENAARFAVLVVAALAAVTFVQVGYWRDSVTLWEHAVAVNPKVSYSLHKLGESYEESDDFEKAEEAYQKAIDQEQYPPSAFNLAEIQYRQKRFDEAEKNFLLNIQNPNQRTFRTHTRCFLGKIALYQHEYPKAIDHLKKVIDAEDRQLKETQQIPSEDAFDAMLNLILAYYLNDESAEALERMDKSLLVKAALELTEASRATPGALRLVAARGWIAKQLGKKEAAATHFELLDRVTEKNWRKAFTLEAERLALLSVDQGGSAFGSLRLGLIVNAAAEPDVQHLYVLALAYVEYGLGDEAKPVIDQAVALAKKEEKTELLEALEKLREQLK